MRTTKAERKKNALQFYQLLMNGACDKTAIVVKRTESSNPNISRCQFLSVLGIGMSKPVVIAESILGIEGCFIELLGNIKNINQITFYEEGFTTWLKIEFHMSIAYQDGFVFMIERV